MIIFIPIVSFGAVPLQLTLSFPSVSYHSSFLHSNSFMHSISLYHQYLQKLYIPSSSPTTFSPSRLFMRVKTTKTEPSNHSKSG